MVMLIVGGREDGGDSVGDGDSGGDYIDVRDYDYDDDNDDILVTIK